MSLLSASSSLHINAMSEASNSSVRNEDIKNLQEPSDPPVETSTMTKIHNTAFRQQPYLRKINLSLDLVSLDNILKDLDQVMPPSTPVEKDILKPNKYDIESTTLPRRKRPAKQLRNHPPKESEFACHVHSSGLGVENAQKDDIESQAQSFSTAIPWNSMTNITEIEDSKVGLGSKSNLVYLIIILWRIIDFVKE